MKGIASIVSIFMIVFMIIEFVIWVVSNFIAHYLGVVGLTYWCVVIVSFLILSKVCLNVSIKKDE